MSEALLIKVPVGDGADDVIEVQVSRAELDGMEESGVVLAAGDGRRLDVTAFSLASAVDHVMPALRTIAERLRGGVHAPDEVDDADGAADRRGGGFLFCERHGAGEYRGDDDLAQGAGRNDRGSWGRGSVSIKHAICRLIPGRPSGRAWLRR